MSIPDEKLNYEYEPRYRRNSDDPSLVGLRYRGGKESPIEDGPPSSDGLNVDFKHDLHRGLKSRQIAMVIPELSHNGLTLPR
jgi:hypothetical protein